VCSGADTGDVFERLASLVDKSLVVAVPQPDGAPTRYRMLETICAYSVNRLDEAGERAAAVAAHARVMVDLAETAEPHLRTAEQLGWLTRLRAESDEIDIALRRAVEARDAATAHRLLAAMVWSWLIRGRTDDAERWTTAVHALDGPAPAGALALNAAYLAVMSVGRGDTTAARRHVRTAVALAERLPRPWHPVLQLAGPITAQFVDRDGGPLAALSTDTPDRWLRGFALASRAQVAENEGRFDEQRELLRAAHEQLATVGERFGLGMIVHSLGELEDIGGNHSAAARAYDEAIALATELGNDDDLPQFLSRRALLEARRGDIGAARAILDRVDDTRVGPFNEAGALAVNRAHIDLLAGETDRARIHLALAETELRTGGVPRPGDTQRRAYLSMGWAMAELADGAPAAARVRLADAVAAAAEAKDGPVTATVAEVAARLALAEGDASAACLLLGVATAQRGTLDHGSPDVRATLAAVRSALGHDAADELVRAGAALPRADGVDRLVAYADPGVTSVPGTR
jgi:tetratricopeptide (TPR) repeat protein